jgi:hypothetical protein
VPVPDELGRLVAGLPRKPRERLDALVQKLDDLRTVYDPKAPAGQSYPRLVQHVTGAPTERGSITGASSIEQPVATLALLARLAGLPSRVVVGYVTPVGPLDPAAGTRTLSPTSRQAWAWVEVHLDGEGWVAVDAPLGEPRTRANQVPAPAPVTSTTMAGSGRSPIPATTVAPAPSPAAGTDTCGDTGEGCAAGRRLLSVPWPLVALALLIAAPAAVVAAKRLRRWRRRHHPAPARRLHGAWLETVSALRSRGLAVPRAATAAEVADGGRSALGDTVAEPLTRWSRLLDTAVFSRHEPDDDLAEEAWRLHRTVTDALRTTRNPVSRALVAVDPRPLLRRP